MSDEIDGWELNRKARQLADDLVEADIRMRSNLPYTAFERAFNSMRRELMLRLNSALSSIKEYGGYGAWRKHITQAFEQNARNMISLQGRFIYIEPQYVLGGLAEFMEGVMEAKALLGLDGRMSEEQAAWFWRTFIYMPAREGASPLAERADEQATKGKGKKKKGKKKKRDYIAYGKMLYERTINARLAVWGDRLAPEWIWLENGNEYNETAYPRYSGTKFVERAEVECQAIFNEELALVEEEGVGNLNIAVQRFLDNPEMYQPGEILDYILVEGVEFKLHVTPTRQFGVRRVSY